jgi:hypothetical protein
VVGETPFVGAMARANHSRQSLKTKRLEKRFKLSGPLRPAASSLPRSSPFSPNQTPIGPARGHEADGIIHPELFTTIALMHSFAE